MWNSSGVQQNSEQGESVLAGQMGRLHGGEVLLHDLSLADSKWVVRVESELSGDVHGSSPGTQRAFVRI